MPHRSFVALLVAAVLGACSFPDYGFEQNNSDILARICTDNRTSAAETGVDCGGGCPPCRVDAPCKVPTDCLTLSCVNGRCQQAACDDEIKNGSESDRDCGGQCARRCGTGKDCSTGADCISSVCADGSCLDPSCADGQRNGTETGADCGGSCAACASGSACSADDDCVSRTCAQQRCVEPHCTDGSLNGNETDLDCGGPECHPCAPGLRCRRAGDCQTSNCDATFRCAESHCEDGILNGDESDVDCGGSSCTPCSELKLCGAGADCLSGVCQSARCVPAVPTGEMLSKTGWAGQASNTFSGDSPTDVFDDDLGTIWSTGTPQQTGMFFQVDLGAVRTFYAVEFKCSVHGDYAGAFDIYLWQDGQPTAPVRSKVLGLPDTSVEFVTPQIARYIRLVLAEPKSSWWCMDELYVRR